MSKIQDVPFITKVIDTLSDELKSGLYDLIDGQVKTPVFRSLVNNDYAITEANDKGKVQFVTLETLRGNYTGYLAYNSVYCVLIAFKGNTQALDMLNINVAKHTFAFVNESLSILELRVELEDGKKGVTPTDLGVTNNNIHLAKGTTQIGEGVNLKTVGGETIVGSGNVGFKTINDQEIVGDGNIVVGEGGTITIDETTSTTSENALMNKVITNALDTKLALPTTAPATRKVVTIDTNGAQDNVDPTELPTLMSNIVDSHGNKRFIEGDINLTQQFSNLGITKLYGKWSLSGTHLMIVIAINIPANVTTPVNGIICIINFPGYIKDKLIGLWDTTLDIKNFMVRNATAWYLNSGLNLKDVTMYTLSDGRIVIQTSASRITTEVQSTCRIQFDFLIDSD